MHEPLQEGYYYHIYNRGNNSENIFKDEENYSYFLKKYAKYCYPVLDTYAYCLLKNHFHLLIRIRSEDEMDEILSNNDIDMKDRKRLADKEWSSRLVSQQLGHLFNGYTQAINKKYDRSGSLFERPFERKQVNESSYFCKLVCYIHQNPQLHGFESDFSVYNYSSYSSYLTDRSSKINKTETLRRFGGLEGLIKAHDVIKKIPEEYIFD